MTWLLLCYWYEPEAPRDPVGLVRIWQLARHLAARGDRVTLLAPNYASTRRQRPIGAIGIPLLHLPLLRPLSYALGSFLAGLLVAWQRTPDVVYYRWMDSPHPILLARLFRSLAVCEVNGEPVPDWERKHLGVKARIKHWLARQALRRCDRVVVLTEGLRDLVIQRYGATPEGVIVLPSGTDLDLFRPQPAQDARRRLGLLPASSYIGFVGSFYRYQGLTCLLDAFALVRRERPDTRLLLVGDGEAAADLRDQASRLGLGDSVIWTGRVPYDRVPDYINAMTICVAPFCGNRGETSPVKLFDYLACARPVVASAIPSVASLFSEREGVAQVPPEDPGALARSLLRLLGDQPLAAELGARGQRVVHERFGWSRVADGLRDWLKEGRMTSAHANTCILR